MSARDQILTELHSLIDEQMKVLQERLGPPEVVLYAERKRRIERLIELLSADGSVD
jgi:hypothetical protein